MKAVVRTRFGSPDILEIKEVPKPVPNSDQVLIGIHSTAVNPVDRHILRGQPFLIRMAGFGLVNPKHHILGADTAGIVEAVGDKVTALKVGDEVFGSAIGGFAEYACFPERSLAAKPKGVSFEQAATIPIAGLTALQGLRDHGRVSQGQRVLINGASGGVGTFAVQIAKTMGAHVTGVCSTRNLDFVRSLGADEVIDYTNADFTRGEQKYDVILDTVARRSVLKSARVLNSGGTYVMIGGATIHIFEAIFVKPWTLLTGGKKVGSMIARTNTADLTYVANLIESGQIAPVIDKHYTLSDTPEALRYVEAGHTRGKIVITIRE